MPDQRLLDTRLEALRTVARTVTETLAEHPQIVSVILFGSGAHGAIPRQSDIDLLAVCDPEIMEVRPQIRTTSTSPPLNRPTRARVHPQSENTVSPDYGSLSRSYRSH